MNFKASAVTALVLLTLAVQSAFAVGGYNHVAVPAHSDVHLTVPFNGNIFETHAVTAVAGSTLSVADSLTANQYAGAYYVRFTSGSANGLWSTVASNGAGDYVLEDAAVAAEAAVGDTFRVYRHHTISSIFPKGLLNVSYKNLSKVLVYENDINTEEENKSAVTTIRYLESLDKWIGGQGGNTILAPETQFVLRNDSADGLDFYCWGVVPDHAVSMLIPASGDIVVGTGYPVPVALTGSGLEGNLRKVLIFDNQDGQQNKSASLVARYVSSLSKWIGVALDQVLAPSEAFTFRLPAGETGTRVTITKPY